MSFTKTELIRVNSILEYIEGYCPYFKESEYIVDELFSSDAIDEIVTNKKEVDDICIGFPGDDLVEISADDLLELDEDLRTIEIVDSGFIKTKYRSIYIYSSRNNFESSVLSTLGLLVVSPRQGVRIELSSSSIIVGLVATKLGAYEDDYVPTYSGYTVVSIIYDVASNRLEKYEELEMLDSFIFELADTADIVLTKSEIYYDNAVDEYEERIREVYHISDHLQDLIPANAGMSYFVSASQISDPELKFLSYYKVIEHFSTIAVNIDAFELMRKKLNAPRLELVKRDYIKSIFDLVNSVRDRQSDEELVKSAFSKCFDFVGLFHELPDSIKKTIRKRLKVQKFDYSLDPQAIILASGMAAKIVYKIRNGVVHAKSNHRVPDGEFDGFSNFNELNSFMKKACSQTIRWYARLPNHEKTMLI